MPLAEPVISATFASSRPDIWWTVGVHGADEEEALATNRHVTAEELRADIESGRIDTVIVAFADHQGRLVGKRTDGEFYLDHGRQGRRREL